MKNITLWTSGVCLYVNFCGDTDIFIDSDMFLPQSSHLWIENWISNFLDFNVHLLHQKSLFKFIGDAFGVYSLLEDSIYHPICVCEALNFEGICLLNVFWVRWDEKLLYWCIFNGKIIEWINLFSLFKRILYLWPQKSLFSSDLDLHLIKYYA